MKTKSKVNSIIFLTIALIAGLVAVIGATKNWMKYSVPVDVKNVELGIYPAQDYPVDGNKSYFYKVTADIKYSAGNWPDVDKKILKSDTILLLHDCSHD